MSGQSSIPQQQTQNLNPNTNANPNSIPSDWREFPTFWYGPPPPAVFQQQIQQQAQLYSQQLQQQMQQIQLPSELMHSKFNRQALIRKQQRHQQSYEQQFSQLQQQPEEQQSQVLQYQNLVSAPNNVTDSGGAAPSARSSPADDSSSPFMTTTSIGCDQTTGIANMTSASTPNRYTSTPLSTQGGKQLPFPPDLSMIHPSDFYQRPQMFLPPASYFPTSSSTAAAQTMKTPEDSGSSTMSHSNTTSGGGRSSSGSGNENANADRIRDLMHNSIMASVDSIESSNLSGNPTDLFCEVAGRLSVLNGARKYQVTIGEIYRRIYGPEGLNASIIVSILRKAKNKHGSSIMRKKLHPYNIDLMPGRRKNVPSTTFTALSEGEAHQLALDYITVARSCYSPKFIGKRLRQLMDLRMLSSTANFRKMINTVTGVLEDGDARAFSIQQPFKDVMDNSPLSRATAGATRFSLLTHGFGNKCIADSMKLMQEFLLSTLEVLKEEVDTGSCEATEAPTLAQVIQENEYVTKSLKVEITKQNLLNRIREQQRQPSAGVTPLMEDIAEDNESGET